jgi:predicted amidohydrolase
MTLFKGKATTLAVAQFLIEPGRREENQARVAELLATAAGRGADLVCLPGTFATGLNFPTLRSDATASDGPVVQFLADQAGRHGIHIAAGVLLSEGRDVYDAAVLVGADGATLGWYRRACVWAGESDYVSTGTPGDVVDTSVGRIGLLVGYDLRFPEACRQYLLQGVDVIVCTANLFTDYSHPVRSIARTRAADNECAFVLASGAGENRFVGKSYLGRSMIVDGLVQDAALDPDADVIAEIPSGVREGVIDGQIFLRQQRRAREALPFHGDLASTWTVTHRGVAA